MMTVWNSTTSEISSNEFNTNESTKVYLGILGANSTIEILTRAGNEYIRNI